MELFRLRACGFHRIGLSWTEPLWVSANWLRSVAQGLKELLAGALGKVARRHEVCWPGNLYPLTRYRLCVTAQPIR